MNSVILKSREKAVMTIFESCHWWKIEKPYQGLGVERHPFEDREFN
jgi:hypothetical protein